MGKSKCRQRRHGLFRGSSSNGTRLLGKGLSKGWSTVTGTYSYRQTGLRALPLRLRGIFGRSQRLPLAERLFSKD